MRLFSDYFGVNDDSKTEKSKARKVLQPGEMLDYDSVTRFSMREQYCTAFKNTDLNFCFWHSYPNRVSRKEAIETADISENIKVITCGNKERIVQCCQERNLGVALDFL
jgi:hypothetical protein